MRDDLSGSNAFGVVLPELLNECAGLSLHPTSDQIIKSKSKGATTPPPPPTTRFTWPSRCSDAIQNYFENLLNLNLWRRFWC